MKIVGLTGGIATGKSTVADLLRARGVPVLDADAAAREVVAKGTEGLAAVVEAFGPEVLDPAGHLDRAAMRARIARDPETRRILEGITHPRIGARIGEALQALDAPLAVVEAALLVETGSYRRYAALIVVSCAPETQLQRLMARDGMPEAAARALIATQLPMAEKEAVATHVIRNDGGLGELEREVDRVWADLGQ